MVREAERSGEGILGEQICVKHSGIVGGESDGQAAGEELGERMIPERCLRLAGLLGQSAGGEIAGEAIFEDDLARGESFSQGRDRS